MSGQGKDTHPVRRRKPRDWVTLGAKAVLTALVFHARCLAEGPPPPVPLEVPSQLRLLVVAPHPDDEILGAGGLMQRVRARKGRVHVAYLTNGDGYVDGVELETGRLKPRPQDFVDYGELRQREAVQALQAIAVRPRRAFFYGFPDGGLDDLLTTHWSAKNPYLSPYTHDDRPPYLESVNRAVRYSGVALERELALAVTASDPDWIAVTAPWDIHPDHCAAFHFVVRALNRLTADNPGFLRIRILAYTVHRPDWPSASEGKALAPPPQVEPDAGGWRSLALTTAELDGKGRALDQYTSQMDIMAVVFRGFVRPNEIFAVSSIPLSEPAWQCGGVAN